MRCKKGAIGFLLTLIILISMMTPVFAENSDFVINFGILTRYLGDGGAVIIPDGVTSIRKDVFRGNTKITSVTIPSGVKEIDSYTFYECTNLKNVSMPEGLEKIGNDAFEQCSSLVSIVIPDSVTEIQGAAFRDCESLENLYLSKQMTKIDTYTFARCKSLKRVVIPDGVTKIGSRAFEGCESLENMEIPSSVVDIEEWAFDGTPWLKNQKNGDFMIVGSVLLKYCGKDKEVTIPNGVTGIAAQAFYGREDIQKVVIPEGVTTIGDEAFYDCWFLFDVYIPSTVTDIGFWAFDIEKLDYEEGAISAYSPAKNYFLTVHGASGSYAEKYAKGSGLIFEADYGTVASPAEQVNSTSRENEPATAIPTNDGIALVTGCPLAGGLSVPTIYKINGYNYFKLRDVAMMLSETEKPFAVNYDASSNAVDITIGQVYAPVGGECAGMAQESVVATPSSNTIYVNGQKCDLNAYQINGNNYFKIRDLGDVAGFAVAYEDGDIVIYTV